MALFEAFFGDGYMSPIDALRAATINAAEFLQREKDLGTVETGKLADLVLLDANPLEQIAHTQKIAAVIANGRYLPAPELRKLLDRAALIVSGSSHVVVTVNRSPR